VATNPRRLLWPSLVAILALAGPARASAVAGGQDRELKAAIIYNFARFAAWPPARFADEAAPVILCVDPSDPLLPDLSRLDGQPVGPRRLQVRATAQFGPGCHLAYVAETMNPAAIANLQRQGMLTIGDAPGFARSGAIGLVRVGRQIRFEVNTGAAASAGVKLSSQLLRLAMVVR
jgi:hypothetical protein